MNANELNPDDDLASQSFEEEETKKESTSETFLKRKLESKISGRRSPKEEEIGMIEVATSPAGQIEKLSDLDDQMELARTSLLIALIYPVNPFRTIFLSYNLFSSFIRGRAFSSQTSEYDEREETYCKYQAPHCSLFI